MLVRPSGGHGFDVLMLRRSGASHFVPDAYVFPGGSVDSSDYSEDILARIQGLGSELFRREFRMQSRPELQAPAGVPELRDAQALVIAALRELYEEAGVLLACDADGKPCAVHTHHHERVPFLEALRRHNAYGDAQALALFSHWITPATYPRRYNTYFFLAIAGEDQLASADAVETSDGMWIAPQRALDESAAGRFSLVYPTIKHLERLAAFDDVHALMAYARSKPIYSIMPHVEGEHRFALPETLEKSW